MSKTPRCLSDVLFARFLVALGRNDVSIEIPEPDVGLLGRSYLVQKATVYAGGVRAVEFYNDVLALIDERDTLRKELEHAKDEARAKVSVNGGKATVSRAGVITIRGGSVTIKGNAELVEVTA